MENKILDKAIFGQRFSEVFSVSNETTYSLAEKLSLSAPTISRYAKGQMAPKIPTLFVLADLFSVNPYWLMGYDAPKYANRASNPSIYDIPNIFPLPKSYNVPLLGNVACGDPILAEQNIADVIPVPEAVKSADFALACKGDSMINARIFDGDIVYIHMQDTVENGEIAAVLIGDEATLKKVYYTPGGNRITLRPCNPLYPDMEYSGEELNKIRVLGKAVAFTSKIKI